MLLECAGNRFYCRFPRKNVVEFNRNGICYMKKILFVLTSIVLAAGIVYTAAGSKEQPNNLVKKDSEQLLARMGDPGSGMG